MSGILLPDTSVIHMIITFCQASLFGFVSVLVARLQELRFKLNNHYLTARPLGLPTCRVVEIVSGDCLVVRDSTTGVERRVTLSRWEYTL